MGATIRVFVIPRSKIDEHSLSRAGYQWFIDHCYDNHLSIVDDELPVVSYENALCTWLNHSDIGKRSLDLGATVWVMSLQEIDAHMEAAREALRANIADACDAGYTDELYSASWGHMSILLGMAQLRDILRKYLGYTIVIDAAW